MYQVNDDMSIYVTRGDIVNLVVTAEDDGEDHVFQSGDVVRIKVFTKKDCETVVMQKDFPVTTATEAVELFLDENDTKIGEVISKPRDYWYEVELNPDTNPQTIIGYDEDGAKVFKLFPEGRDLTENDPVIKPEDIPIVDEGLDLSSARPVENRVVTRALYRLEGAIRRNREEAAKSLDNISEEVKSLEEDLAIERARIGNILALPDGSTTNDARLEDICVGADGVTYESPADAVRGQVGALRGDIESIADIVSYPNLITDYSVREGRLLNGVGWTQEDAEFNTLDVGISVRGGANYCFSVGGFPFIVAKIVFKTIDSIGDGAEGYIKSQTNIAEFEAPSDALYVFISLDSWVDATKLVLQEAREPMPVEPIAKIKSNVELEISTNNVKDCAITPQKTTFFDVRSYPNLIDSNDDSWIMDALLNNVGATENAEWFMTYRKPVAIRKGETLSFGEALNKIVIKKNKVLSNNAADVITLKSNVGFSYTLDHDSTEDGVEYYAFLTWYYEGASPFVIKNSKVEKGDTLHEYDEHVSLKDVSVPYMVKNNLYGKKMMTLGDSLTEGGFWQNYVADRLGLGGVVDLGVGGAKVNAFADKVTAENIEDIDIVTVMGVFNSTDSKAGTVEDSASDEANASICAGYKFIIDKLLKLNPSVKIVLMSPHRPRANDVALKAEAVGCVAKYYGLPFIDLYNTAGFNEYTYDIYLRDSVHSSYGEGGGYEREAEVITGGLLQYFG